MPPAMAQASLMSTCIAYLSLEHFKQGVCESYAAQDHRFNKYPFTLYAATTWGDHARGQPEVDCGKLIVDFLSDSSLRAAHLQAANATWSHRCYGGHAHGEAFWSQIYWSTISVISCAASCGLTRIVSHYVADGAKVDANGKDGTSALHQAATNGHFDTVEILLQAGAKLDSLDESCSTALYLAVQKGHVDVVELLVGKGASMELKNNIRAKHIIYAIDGGNTSLVQYLLSLEERVNNERLALAGAIYRGSPK